MLQDMVATLTQRLLKEIEAMRAMTEVALLNEDTFDPTLPRTCFLGQMFHGDLGRAEHYRDKIGMAFADLSIYRGDVMTPLEVWSAYMWDIDKELVLKVFRYIKGTTDILPDIRYDEVQIMGEEPQEDAF